MVVVEFLFGALAVGGAYIIFLRNLLMPLANRWTGHDAGPVSRTDHGPDR